MFPRHMYLCVYVCCKYVCMCMYACVFILWSDTPLKLQASFIYLSMYLFFHLSIYVSIHLSTHLSIYSCVHVFMYSCIYLHRRRSITARRRSHPSLRCFRAALRFCALHFCCDYDRCIMSHALWAMHYEPCIMSHASWAMRMWGRCDLVRSISVVTTDLVSWSGTCKCYPGGRLVT